MSNMKSNADTTRSFLIGLLEYFSRTVSSPSGKVDEQNETPLPVKSPSGSSTTSNPSGSFSSPPVDQASLSTSSNQSLFEMPPLSELGEMPAVQDRFQTVLKNRLQMEIAQNPPMFPWESSLQEYPMDIAVPAYSTWLTQLRSLQLPTSLPEDVLSGLLQRCQEVALESLQPGIQLVKAIESLFPEQSEAMGQVAELVLASGTVRHVASPNSAEGLKSAFPDGYEGATPQQQVALAMLAARDILDALTIVITPQQPTVAREWLTTDGKITLHARYEAGNPGQISLSVELPRAGQLSIPALGETLTLTQAGTLTLSLPNPESGERYALEIFFNDLDSVPLTFAIRWASTAD